MRRIVSYSAVSLNFKIAKEDGSIDWLETIDNPEKIDYGYSEFYKSVDATIMGYNTYAQIKSWGIEFPYRGKSNFVFTSRTDLDEDSDVEYVTENHYNFLAELKSSAGGDIWLVGGSRLNSSCLSRGLIDELIVFVMPIILENGIDLFANIDKDFSLKPSGLKKYGNGVVELKYSL